MNAKEAKELTAKHNDDEKWLKTAMDLIIKECNAGFHQAHFSFLDKKTTTSLLNLGYKIDKDLAGNTIVSWWGEE